MCRLSHDFLPQLHRCGFIHWIGCIWTPNCSCTFLSDTRFELFSLLASGDFSKGETDCLRGWMAAAKIRHFQGGGSDSTIPGSIQRRDDHRETHRAARVWLVQGSPSICNYEFLVYDVVSVRYVSRRLLQEM